LSGIRSASNRVNSIRSFVTSRQGLAVEFILFTMSVLLMQGARFAYNIGVAHALPTGEFTYWALLLAALSYAPALLGGSLNGLGRQLPYLRGAGQLDAAEAAESTLHWTLVIVLLGVLAAAFAGTFVIGALALPLGLAVGGTLVFSVQQFVLRSSLAFNRASIQQLVFGLGVSSVALLMLLNTSTLGVAAFGYAICLVLAIALGLLLHPPSWRRPTWGAFVELTRIGFPIMVAGVIFSVFVTSDRWIASALLGQVRAAPYALASVVGSSMLIIPTVISQQTYPRMAILYGKTGDRAQVYGMARRQSLLAGVAAFPLALVGAVAVIVFVPIVLPAYRDAVVPACVISLGFAVLAASTGFGNYLNVVGEQWTYLRVQIGSTAVALGLMVVGARIASAIGIAIGISLGYALYGLWLRASTRGGAEPERPGS
jgi:O-antigen/teichoic acid export membrane protein